MPYTPKPPTSAEVLARQKAAAAPKPVTPPPAGNGGAVAKVAASGLPAVPDSRTNVEKYLDEYTSPSMIAGRGIKFSKEGKPIYWDTDEEVSPETDFIAICDQAAAGLVLFHKDAPPDMKVGLLYDNFVMPSRESFGNTDPAKWEIGLSGKPEDPVKHQMYLPLQHADTKEMATFVTGSKTGRNAVGALLRHYNRMRKSHPDELPVVRLKVGGFQHKDERIGWVATPTFVVVGRVPADSAARPDTSLSADMNDSLPDFS
jgi:hypothetical protein